MNAYAREIREEIWPRSTRTTRIKAEAWNAGGQAGGCYQEAVWGSVVLSFLLAAGGGGE
jgi:hypothetical protein